MDNPIFVTQALLPDRSIFDKYIDEIFSSHFLTNNGPLVVQLERQLSEYLQISNLALCANGTLALMLAIKALGLSGKKVIVTPFTYVATLTALLWEGCTPLFADIDESSLCISPHAIRKLLSEHDDISGIVPVHVYGIACDVDAIDSIAKDNNLAVIYDASHAFGEKLRGSSLFSFGDVSICSLHATKVYHTVEGGCFCCKDVNTLRKMKIARAFGHVNDNYIDYGINAKLSEVHAAMGLALLKVIDAHIEKRRTIVNLYNSLLPSKYKRPINHPEQTLNYAYYPIIFPNETDLLAALKKFNANNIYPRRYFYPSCNTMPYLQNKMACPISEDISKRVLCLPLYGDLNIKIVEQIVSYL